MSIGATLVASLLATLASPPIWVLALVSFLVRGGFVLVLAPIVVVPSAVGLANVVAPTLTTMVFGGASGELVTLIVALVLAVASSLVIGGFVAAAVEAEAIRIVGVDEEIAGRAPRPDNERLSAPHAALRSALGILLARAIAAGPLAIALASGSVRIVSVAYRELTVPSEVAVPLVVRIVRGAPEAIALVVLAWVVAEIVGAVAARRIVLAGDSVVAALVGAVRHILRDPLRTVIAFVVPSLVLVAVLVPSAAAAIVSWDAIRSALANDAGPVTILAQTALFVGLWLGGLALVGMVSAWRAAVWTVDVARTFGGVGTGRPGDWTPTSDTATLGDLRPHTADPDPR